jgi:hypothetical protein
LFEYDFSIIIHRKYIDISVFFTHLIDLGTYPLQSILTGVGDLIEGFQLAYQLLDALQVGLKQDPPWNCGHLYL